MYKRTKSVSGKPRTSQANEILSKPNGNGLDRISSALDRTVSKKRAKFLKNRWKFFKIGRKLVTNRPKSVRCSEVFVKIG